ncbi:MAG: hypothetical protein QNJ14_04300 [Woeseiaceae bacterium]|nr:hypothetical protein [Woeseiaceae bacterium]
MKITNYIVCVFVLFVMTAPSPLWAKSNDAHISLIVSREAGGSINKESKESLRTLAQMARKNGYMRVWVTLDIPYDPFLAERSEQGAAVQQERLDGLFDQVLNPMLADGEVQYENGKREYRGPSLLLKVTRRGLFRLVDDRRVGQLVGVP